MIEPAARVTTGEFQNREAPMFQRVPRARAPLIAGLLTLPLFQSCSVSVSGPPGLFFNAARALPHFDGSNQNSFLDRFFGFDDDRHED